MLAGQARDQVLELKQIAKLDADLAAAFAVGGDADPAADGVANPPLQFGDIELVRAWADGARPRDAIVWRPAARPDEPTCRVW